MQADYGITVDVVDLGVHAGPAPNTNACQWLSAVAGLSRVQTDRADVADVDLWDAIANDVAAVGLLNPIQLQAPNRRSRQDSVGAAADFLRGHVCAAMATAVGQERWMPFFAQHFLQLKEQNPHGGGAKLLPIPQGANAGDYGRHLAALRTRDFADHLTLIEIAERLRVCIMIIPSRPDWNVATIDPAGVGEARRIFLGNNDVHYVWLRQRA
jgi:hypothetical protein